jgi:hypothetical protein
MRAACTSAGLAVVLSMSLATRTVHALDAPACVQAAEEAQKLRKSGALLAAQDQLVACSDLDCPSVVRVACADWLGEVRKAIPSVVFAAKEALPRCGGGDPAATRDVTDVDVSMDGRLLTHRLDGRAVSLDPGSHVFRFALADDSATPREETIQLREGEKLRAVSVVLDRRNAAPCPAPTPRSAPVGAYMASAISGLSLGGFTYFAISSHVKYRNLLKECAPTCDSQTSQPFLVEQDLADVFLGVGVVAAAVATWLFLSTPQSNVQVRPASRGAALRVSF